MADDTLPKSPGAVQTALFLLALLPASFAHADSPPTGPGKFGRALRPAETYAAAPPLSAMYFTVPRTVECWAKINGKETDTPLIAYEPRSSIEHWALYAAKGSGALSADLTGVKLATVTSGQNIADGQWHYLAMTFDGSAVRLFVDAKKVADQPVQTLHGYSDMGPLTFGHAEGMATPKDVLLDEVRLSRGLRPIEAVPTAPFDADDDTVGLWHFDEEPPAAAEGEPAAVAFAYADASRNHNKARPASGDEEFVSTSPQSTKWQEEDHGPFFTSSLTSPLPVKNDTNKGLSIRLGPDGKAGVCFDTELLRVSAAWVGGFMKIYPGRDGLAQHPNPDGTVEFGCGPGIGWGKGDSPDYADPRPDHAGPLAADSGRYRGLYLNGQRVIVAYTAYGSDVLESFDLEAHDGEPTFGRTLEVGPAKDTLVLRLFEQPQVKGALDVQTGRVAWLQGKDGTATVAELVGGAADATRLRVSNGRMEIVFPAHDQPTLVKVLLWSGKADGPAKFAGWAEKSEPPAELQTLTHGGPARWAQPVVTKGDVAKPRGPYVVDTLTAPDKNPWKSYLRFSGLDFFKNGDAAVCSISGDVWIVSGIDEKLDHLTWRRYATGLFQPLGLRIVDDVVYVLGRDQITRLHDLNHSGEADFYENFNNGCKVTPGGHEFCTCLETDPAGNFYYTKCGNPTAHGGTMLKVSRDGSQLSVFAVGLRNPNGMGVSPDGTVYTSDNEGEWVPASRIDLVHEGQFLGFTPMAHGAKADHPGYPIWIPHSLDNSSGGQVWVPADDDQWGPLAGAMLHTSYGASSLYRVLPEVVNGRLQGGVFHFPLRFASGIMRARFNPKDGQLYVCGLRGWQTNGVRDGALQRVRYTGKTAAVPTELHAHANGLKLTFSVPLDRKSAADVENWGVSQWNYRWTAGYGSRDYSVIDPQKQGHDVVEVKAARVSKDGRSVFLEMPTIRPVMQMEVKYNVEAEDGTPMEQEIYNTIHELGPAE